MAQRWEVVGALVDAGRRALFEYVQRSPRPVSREEAADALGITRGLAAFHLDKLVGAGLLSARYAAPADTPRGRGRAPKVYEPASGEVAISVPERDYALAAEILVDAVAEDPDRANASVMRAARRHGAALGAGMRTERVDLEAALTRTGYRPQRACDSILLTNCPFHALAARHADLVCGMNLEFVAGLIEGVAATGCTALLAPAPGRCCVEVAVPR
jgi:predicted ArsR family transcriptional regulator